MLKHADVNLQFLQQCGMKVTRVDTTDNVADIFTKIVSAQRLDWHMANFTSAIAVKNKHGSITRAKTEVHEKGCQLAGLRDVGDPAVVTACPCIRSRLLTMLMATLALRGAAETMSADSALTVGGFTEMELGAAFLSRMIVGTVLMYLCGGAAEPAAGNDSDLNEGKIYEHADDMSDGLAHDPKRVHVNVNISNGSNVGLGTTSDIADPVEIMNAQARARAQLRRRALTSMPEGEIAYAVINARATTAYFCTQRNPTGARDKRRGCALCVISCPLGGEILFFSSCGNCYHKDEHCTGLRKAVSVRPCFACRCECPAG